MEVSKCPSAVNYLALSYPVMMFSQQFASTSTYQKLNLYFHCKYFHLYKDSNDVPSSIQFHSGSSQYFWALNNDNLSLYSAHVGRFLSTL